MNDNGLSNLQEMKRQTVGAIALLALFGMLLGLTITAVIATLVGAKLRARSSAQALLATSIDSSTHHNDPIEIKLRRSPPATLTANEAGAAVPQQSVQRSVQ